MLRAGNATPMLVPPYEQIKTATWSNIAKAAALHLIES
jgi:hypothetical protein